MIPKFLITSLGALFALLLTGTSMSAAPNGDWLQFGGAATATRFSELSQIDTSNVDKLRIDWVKELDFTGRVQGAPAAWNGTLFVSTETGLVALDGASGQVKWKYAEGNGTRTDSGLPIQAPRGSPVVLPLETGAIVFASLPSAPVVFALDAQDGALKWRTNVGDPDYADALRSNPILAGDVLILGPTGADLSPTPGRLVALKVDSGAFAWTFDLVPVSESDPARASWSPYTPGRAFGVGGGSAWNVGAFDPQTGIVVYGTGEPVPSDQLDPRRFDGDGLVSRDLYTSSFVALDAETGELRWHHQVVPGDEWGYDQHTVPLIIDLQIGGEQHRVVLLATTTGFVLVVDMVSGELLSNHSVFTSGNVHLGYDDDGLPIIDERMRRQSTEQLLTVCPGTRWASIAPGAFSPQTGLMYRPNDTVCVKQGTISAPNAWQPGTTPTWLLPDVRSSGDYFDRWGALTAIDPLDGEIAWSFDVAYPHDSGVLATAGGLVFSAFADRQFRAFDAASGEVLWSQVLSAHSDAAPISYEVDGVQYVAVMAGRDTPVASLPEAGLPDSITGPATLFAFALPAAP